MIEQLFSVSEIRPKSHLLPLTDAGHLCYVDLIAHPTPSNR